MGPTVAVQRSDGPALIAFGLLLASLLWAPLPLGSNRVATAWVLLVIVAVAAMLAAWAAVTNRPAAGGVRGAEAAGRTAPLPAAVVWVGCALSLPWLIGMWQRSPWGTTEDAHATLLHDQRAMAYLLGFVACVLLARAPGRLMALLVACFAAGVMQSMLALMLFSSRAEFVFDGAVIRHGQRALGTYANPDHLANLLAYAIAAGVGLVLAGWKPGHRMAERGWRGLAADAMAFMMSPRMLVRLLLVLCVITLVLTRSRMGNAAVFLVLPVVGGLLMWRSSLLRRPAAVLVASLLLVDIIVVGQWVGLNKVLDRLERTDVVSAAQAGSSTQTPGALSTGGAGALRVPQEESLGQRLVAARDALAAVAERPGLGWGGGTFFTVFPGFRSPEAHYGGTYPHAHNDYVEIAAETGVPAMIGLLLVGAATFVRAVRLMDDHQPPPVRGLAVASAFAILCAFVHAWVDFNLHVTANAYTLTILVSAVWAAPLQAPPMRRRRPLSGT